VSGLFGNRAEKRRRVGYTVIGQDAKGQPVKATVKALDAYQAIDLAPAQGCFKPSFIFRGYLMDARKAESER
jgi:hypothetical protein